MEQVDPLWYAIFHCWCQTSGGSWATVPSKVTSYCSSVLASILTIVYFLGHIECITWHSDLWLFGFFSVFVFFQMWLRNLTGSPSENVIMFPLYLPRFYGGVEIKTLRKNRYPNLLSYCWNSLAFIFAHAFWLSDEKSLPSFPLHIQLFLHWCQAFQVPGSFVPRIFTPSWLFVVSSLAQLFPILP